MGPLSRRSWFAVGIAFALLCGIRALLPIFVESRVVAALARNERYAGSFDDVDVSVVRMAYSIENLRLVKRDGRVPLPFVIAERVEYALDRMALLQGHVAGRIEVSSPELNLVDGPTPELRQGPLGVDWRVTLRKLFPTSVNRIDIREGAIHFRNFQTKPEVDVYLDRLEIHASNVRLRPGAAKSRVVQIRGSGVTMASGSIAADFRLISNTVRPSFDCSVSIEGVQLPQWNAFLRAYAGLEVERGSARIDAEIRSRDGRLHGYVKPFVSDLRALRFRGEASGSSPLSPVSESLIDVVADVLTDPDRHSIAARIPISGTLQSPQQDYWASVRSMVVNAFVESLEPGLEGERGAH